MYSSSSCLAPSQTGRILMPPPCTFQQREVPIRLHHHHTLSGHAPSAHFFMRKAGREFWTLRCMFYHSHDTTIASRSRPSQSTHWDQPPRIPGPDSLQMPETRLSAYTKTSLCKYQSPEHRYIALRPRVTRTAIQATQFRQCDAIQAIEFR